MKYLVTISSKAEKAVKKMPMMEKGSIIVTFLTIGWRVGDGKKAL